MKGRAWDRSPQLYGIAETKRLIDDALAGKFSMLLKRLYDARPEGQRQFLKFAFVGGVGFIVDAGTFFLMTHYLGLGLVIARVISSLVFGMTSTWLLNRYLTFRDRRGGSMLAQYLRFATANIIGNLLNIGTHALLVEMSRFSTASRCLASSREPLSGLSSTSPARNISCSVRRFRGRHCENTALPCGGHHQPVRRSGDTEYRHDSRSIGRGPQLLS